MKANGKVACILTGLAILGAVGTGYAYATQPHLTVKNPKVKFEYQKNKSLKVSEKDFLDNVDLDGVNLHIDLPKFMKIGKYSGTLDYTTMFGQKEVKNVEVIVEDTTKPVIDEKMISEIKVEQNAQDVEWEKYFDVNLVTDEQEIKIEANTENVNLKKTGTYTLSLRAVDKSKNETVKEVKVIVVPSNKVKDLTPYIDKKIPVSSKTETAIVEGKTKVGGNLRCVGTKGGEVKKGQYSTKEKQSAYKKKLAEQKKRKEEEARKRKEAEERERQRQQQQYYQQPSQSVSGGNNNNYYGGSSQTQTGNKGGSTTIQRPSGNSGATTQKPSQPNTPSKPDKPATLYGNPTFWSKAEAIAYGETKLEEGFGYRVFQSSADGTIFTIYWFVELF